MGHRLLTGLLLGAAAFLALALPALAADRPARTLLFKEGTPVDRIEVGVLDDVKDRGKRFVGTGTLVLIDATTAAVSVTETVARNGKSTFVIKTAKKTLPKLNLKFTTSGSPAVVQSATSSFTSVSHSRAKLKGQELLTVVPSGFSLGMTVVPENATDDVPLQLRFGAAALPASKSWASTLPPIGDQGQQSSFVGWSSTYYVKTSWEERSDPNWDDTVASGQFSPAWTYNQINGGKDQGSLPSDATQLLIAKGAATLNLMPYSVGNFTTQPSAQVLASAANYKNVDKRFFGDTLNVGAIKEYLASTGPIIFGIKVDSALQQGTGVYTNFVGPNQGGHAIACVGYDDNLSGGAFLLANSWGPNYREQGFVWVTYSAMQNIFLGAWAMVDGPNTGGGGTQPGAPTGFAASNGVSNGYVSLTWDLLPGVKGFQLERAADSGAWQVIATPKADVFSHQDFAVVASHSYSYRLAGVDGAGAVGPYAQATGSTSGGGGGGAAITLTASNPAGGTAYPDRIALAWNTVSGNPFYVILRSDSEEGLRSGQYIVLDYGQNVSSYSDYVAPSSRYAYQIAAIDPATFKLTSLSNTSLGSTSGGAGTANDLGIVSLSESTVVTRGVRSALDIEVLNYGAASAHQVVFVGVYYYFSDGSTGILSYADSYTGGTVPIWYFRHDVSMQSFQYGTLQTQPIAPQYLNASGTANVGFWWYAEVYPADASGNVLTDADMNDNSMYGSYALFVL